MIKMKRGLTSEYFGGTTPLQQNTSPKIQNDLEFDDVGIRNITQMVFHGMRGGDHSKS